MIFASIVGALVILAVLSWRDLHEHTRLRRPEELQGEGEQADPVVEPHPELPSPREGLTPRQITGARRLYVIAFWSGFWGDFLIAIIGLIFPGTVGLLPIATIALLLLFIYASFRMIQVLGHDGLTNAMLCLLLLVPFFALLQYIGLSRRCRGLWGPLEEAPGH